MGVPVPATGRGHSEGKSRDTKSDTALTEDVGASLCPLTIVMNEASILAPSSAIRYELAERYRLPPPCVFDMVFFIS